MKLYKMRNLGQIDRQLRATISITSLLLVLIFSENTFAASTIVAVFVTPILFSAIIAWDPMYALFGITTFKSNDQYITQFAEASLTSELLSECYGSPHQL